MVSTENIVRDFSTLQLNQSVAVSNKKLNGHAITTRESSAKVQQIVDIVQEMMGIQCPPELACIIVGYTQLSLEERLEKAFCNSEKFDCELQQECIQALRDTPEKMTKEVTFQLYQMLARQELPVASKCDNQINCKLLAALFHRMQEIAIQFSNKEREQILQVYEKQMKAVLTQVRADQMSYDDAARECGLPATLIREYRIRIDL